MGDVRGMASIDEQYSMKVSEAVKELSAIQGDSTLNILYVTDLHHRCGGNQLRAARAVRELAGRLELDAILNGGDIGTNGLKLDVVAAQREIVGELSVEGVPLLTVKGNHDDNSIYDHDHRTGTADQVIFPSESREIMLSGLEGVARFDENRPDSLYYYVDIPDKNTRIIVLDCIDIPYIVKDSGELKQNGQWEYAFSAEQLSWVVGVALDLLDKPEWRVLIVSHVPILQEGIVGTDHPVASGERMWELIRAFRDGEGQFARQGPRTVIGCLFGHVHIDQFVYRDGIPWISTLNAWTNQDFPDTPERLEGTMSETAFDILTVDFEQSMMRFYRFGAGEHRKAVF